MTLKPLLSLCLSCILAAAPIAGTYAQNYNLPNLGAAGGSALSPMQEHQLGEEIMVEVRSDPTYLNDPETIDYLMRLRSEETRLCRSGFQLFLLLFPDS